MGTGIDAARAAGAGIHADVIDNFKDQLLLVLIKRLADKSGRLTVPVSEVDNTGGLTLSFSVTDGAFNFVVGRKQ